MDISDKTYIEEAKKRRLRVPEVGQVGGCTCAIRSRSRSTKYGECTQGLYLNVVVTLLR
jgi:hypothetical protein